ncbi:BTB/POZ domain-containing protein At5g41330-like [Manihot esculenta]|uniref:BTB/POZ domain-containing protein At5g41330-like n=1 Tax=Manihot esculenta TaxID=3983 RepID=UPI000B5D560A|nr:BTB/POZ domain-containing protein At5g41330-like [Manihot esculenta]
MAIESCLLNWGIKRVFTITVDNASSNDVAIFYLKKKINGWGFSILNCKYLHMRCIAHIINLVVVDKMKDNLAPIKNVRDIVRYIRQSPARLQKFKAYCEMEVIQNIITIDVGGQLFQTTKQTLALAGPKSLFSKFSQSTHVSLGPLFIDRDPELFSILLSLLRARNLPPKAKAFDLGDLIVESKFYNVEPLLVNSLSNPFSFDAFNLERSLTLPLNGRDFPSSMATTSFGTLHIAHGSKITSFDWALQRKSTILTQFTAIDSLLAISPTLVAAGVTDFSGMQI